MAKAKQLPSWTTPGGAAKRLAVYRAAGFACQDCGLHYGTPGPGYDGTTALFTTVMVRTKIKLRVLEIDHIIPRRHGGTNDLTNLQALCSGCNARKGAKVVA